jgi:hypothetical protein
MRESLEPKEKRGHKGRMFKLLKEYAAFIFSPEEGGNIFLRNVTFYL